MGGDIDDEGDVGRPNLIEELPRVTAKHTQLCVVEADKRAPGIDDGEDTARTGN